MTSSGRTTEVCFSCATSRRPSRACGCWCSGPIATTSLSQAHALRDTLGVLRRQRGVARVELTGLDDNGVVSFLEAAAGQTLDDAGVGLAHAVYRETDGNPFFVSEVLRHLSETGAIYQDASGRWMAEDSLERMALPDSVREVIGGRVGATRTRRRAGVVHGGGDRP